MAGVTPQHRAGSNATMIGMVVAIVVAVLLLGVLIWLFTQQETLRDAADRAKRVQERLATGNDEAAARQIFPEGKATQRTLVGEMVAGVKLLCGRLVGNQDASPQTAVKELEDAIADIKEKVSDAGLLASAQGAVPLLKSLQELFANEKQEHEKTAANLKKANDDLDAQRKAYEELDKKLKDDLTKLAAKVDELQKAKDDFERVKGGEIKALATQIADKQDTLDQIRKNHQKLMEKARTEIAHRDKSIQEQSQALADLRGPANAQAAEPLVIAREPVGKVLRSLPGDSLVHIGLGRQDKVTLGMTFSVYSANERIPADGHGKATLEVAGVGERTSECRIVTPPPPDEPILPGDGVGNIVLQRNKDKKTRVCVIGSFDTNFDGRPDIRGAEAIKALAQRYGAEIVDTVDAATDYLVIGVVPEESEEAMPPPVEEKKTEAKKVAPPAKESKDAEAEEGDDKADEEAEGEDSENSGDDEKDATEDKPVKADVPKIKKEAEEDPTTGPRERLAKSTRERYLEAVRRAEMFAVPRLRQDQFLNFVGIEVGPDAIKRLAQ